MNRTNRITEIHKIIQQYGHASLMAAERIDELLFPKVRKVLTTQDSSTVEYHGDTQPSRPWIFQPSVRNPWWSDDVDCRQTYISIDDMAVCHSFTDGEYIGLTALIANDGWNND